MGQDVRRQYLNFVATKSARNRLLEDSILKIYVRKSARLLSRNPEIVGRCLDIGSVDYIEPNPDGTMPIGRGFFGNFLKFVEGHNPYDGIYVEIVLSERLREILEKNGYTPAPTDGQSYVKITNPQLVGYKTVFAARSAL